VHAKNRKRVTCAYLLDSHLPTASTRGFFSCGFFSWGTGTYYWNTITNETTMVGEPKPLTMYRQPQVPQQQQVGFGGMIVQSLALGAGVSFAFALVSIGVPVRVDQTSAPPPFASPPVSPAAASSPSRSHMPSACAASMLQLCRASPALAALAPLLLEACPGSRRPHCPPDCPPDFRGRRLTTLSVAVCTHVLDQGASALTCSRQTKRVEGRVCGALPTRHHILQLG
jgi:hypothetical protein